MGPFKTAAEVFTRVDLSPEGREMMNSLLDDLYGQVVDNISKGRGLTNEVVKDLIDKGPYTHSRAKESKLIDVTLYEDELEKAGREEIIYG